MAKLKSKEYKCPICDSDLKWAVGSRSNPNVGITMFCLNDKCPAQEVVGYGINVDAAFNIIQQKYIL